MLVLPLNIDPDGESGADRFSGVFSNEQECLFHCQGLNLKFHMLGVVV